MAKARKTAREKLESHQDRKVEHTPKGRMLIPRPLDVDALIGEVREGNLVSVSQIRERLARDCEVDYTCPLTTGIFIRIAAEAAEEDLSNGIQRITPYWRVIKADGSLNEKLPGGVEAQAIHLKQEGHTIDLGQGKKPPRVKDFEGSLQRL